MSTHVSDYALILKIENMSTNLSAHKCSYKKGDHVSTYISVNICILLI